MARKRRSKEETRKVDALIERLREFVRSDCVTAELRKKSRKAVVV
jgi:hypothetical protein